MYYNLSVVTDGIHCRGLERHNCCWENNHLSRLFHLIIEGKEGRVGTDKSQMKRAKMNTQNTPKKRGDGSENFKANPGVFSHTFYKVQHFDASIKYAPPATTVL